MAENGLAKKLKLKPGMKALIINAPEGYIASLDPLPDGITVSESLEGEYDWVQAFFKTKGDVDNLLPDLRKALQPNGLIWMSFPKGSSKMQTDLTRDKGWDALKAVDLMWLTLVSVNDTWSAFSMRPYKPGEERQTFR
jgi:hypothetical protein